jgi:hypothetical protein
VKNKKFGVYHLLIFTLILASFLAIDEFLLRHKILHEYKWYLLLFFALQSVLTTYIVSQGLQKDAKTFQGFFFASILLRMFLSIAVVFYVVYQGVIYPLWFIVTFFVLYFCFVGFEIYGLLIKLRLKNTTEDGNNQHSYENT